MLPGDIQAGAEIPSGGAAAHLVNGDHREHGAVATASANECLTANALVSAGRSFDAEGPDRRRERYTRPGLCRRRALGSPPVSESGLTPHVLDGLGRIDRTNWNSFGLLPGSAWSAGRADRAIRPSHPHALRLRRLTHRSRFRHCRSLRGLLRSGPWPALRVPLPLCRSALRPVRL
jgi:hypothetical protein